MVMVPVIGAAVAVAVGVGLGTGLVTSTYLESLGMPLVKTVTKAGPGGKLFTGVEVKDGIGPPCYWIHREKGDLAAVDGAELDHWVISR